MKHLKKHCFLHAFEPRVMLFGRDGGEIVAQ
jgi:hypothetical protein